MGKAKGTQGPPAVHLHTAAKAANDTRIANNLAQTTELSPEDQAAINELFEQHAGNGDVTKWLCERADSELLELINDPDKLQRIKYPKA